MARSKEQLATQIAATGLRVIMANAEQIFDALDDGRVDLFEGIGMGGTLARSFVQLAPLIREAKDADWNERDILPIMEALVTQLEQG